MSSAVVGEDGLATGDVAGGSRWLGSAPGAALVLPGCSGASSDAGGRNRDFWVHRGSRRWGVVRVAPQAEWKVPVGFWRFGDGVGMFGLDNGGLWWKLADVWIFGQKKG